MAPEVVDTSNLGRYNEKVDVYSFGILLWELLTDGETPFRHVPPVGIMYLVKTQGKRPPLPPDCPDGYALLTRACWAGLPGDRPSFAEIAAALRNPELLHALHSAAPAPAQAGTATPVLPAPQIFASAFPGGGGGARPGAQHAGGLPGLTSPPPSVSPRHAAAAPPISFSAQTMLSVGPDPLPPPPADVQQRNRSVTSPPMHPYPPPPAAAAASAGPWTSQHPLTPPGVSAPMPAPPPVPHPTLPPPPAATAAFGSSPPGQGSQSYTFGPSRT
jgi:serine/threonine protein kinase